MDFTLGSRSARKDWNDPQAYARQPPPSVSAIRWPSTGNTGNTVNTVNSVPSKSGLDSILPTPTRRTTTNTSTSSVTFATPLTSIGDHRTDAPPPSSMYDVDMVGSQGSPASTVHLQQQQQPNIQFKTPSMAPSMTPSMAPSLAQSQPQTNGWVTVFGFPAGSARAVVNHFRAVGQVVRVEEGKGNWVNLEFSSDWAASRALSRSGSILPGTNCMIGVVPVSSSQSALHQANSFLSPVKAVDEAMTPNIGVAGVEGTPFKRPVKPLVTPVKTHVMPRVHHSAASMNTANTINTANTTNTTNDSIYACANGTDGRQQLSLVQKVFQFIFGW